MGNTEKVILFLTVVGICGLFVLFARDKREQNNIRSVVNTQMEQEFQEIYGPRPDAGAFKDASPAELKEIVKMWEMLRGAFITGTENFRMTNDANLHKALASAAARGRYQRFVIVCRVKPDKGCSEY